MKHWLRGGYADRSILDKFPPKKVYRPRGWRGALKDAWLALRGKTFVTMRGHCFHCGKGFHVEAYQDCVFPMRPRCGCVDPVSLDAMAFNDSHYYPTQLMRASVGSVLESKCGDHMTIPELEELERKVGYGEKKYQTETVEAIQNRYAVRKEHEGDPA